MLTHVNARSMMGAADHARRATRTRSGPSRASSHDSVISAYVYVAEPYSTTGGQGGDLSVSVAWMTTRSGVGFARMSKSRRIKASVT